MAYRRLALGDEILRRICAAIGDNIEFKKGKDKILSVQQLKPMVPPEEISTLLNRIAESTQSSAE